MGLSKTRGSRGGEQVLPGYCGCGCGQKTNLVARNNTARGAVKGQHFRFVAGHRAPAPLESKYIVDPMTGCWNWNGYRDTSGYGRVNIQGEHFAHRYVYQCLVGLIPDGMDLDHLCRNRGCVNPAHLEPVLEITNIRRSRVARLTLVLAQEIRRLAASPGGLPYKEIAELYGVSHQAIGHVVRGETWREDAS